jgi:hypothetical protein
LARGPADVTAVVVDTASHDKVLSSRSDGTSGASRGRGGWVGCCGR